MPVQELITAFANKYYNYSMGVYTEKPTKLNVLEKLNLYTSAVLTGNVANIPNAYDLKAIQDDIVEEFPQKVNIDTINPDVVKVPAGAIYSLYDNVDGYKIFKSSYKDKIMKFQYDSSYPSYFMYIKFSPIDYVYTNYAYYPIVQLISPLGRVVDYLMPDNIYFDKRDQSFRLTASFGSSSIFDNPSINFYPANLVLDNDPLGLYSTAENSYAQGTSDWANPYPVYYPALNSKAATTDELLGLMNVDEYLQREIARMIEEQDRTKERPLVLPEIEAGKVVYPGTQADTVDTPGTGIEVPGGWWDRVLDIPGDIVTGLTPGLDIIRDRVADIPTSINDLGIAIKDFFGALWDTLFGFLRSIVDILTAIKDWLLGLGDFLISLIVPLDFDWATFFDPVMVAFNDKFAPILTPISEIADGLHEDDLEDVYINIDTPMFNQRVKVISYDSLKSVRNTVQWVVRAFFWILILLFNIDQLYRLIRNQSLFNTYVHRIEAQYKEENPAPKQQPLITYLYRK